MASRWCHQRVQGSLGSPVASGEWTYGVAVIVSQDSGFGSAVELGDNIAKGQGRQIVFESAFPMGACTPKWRRRCIPGTKWIHIDQGSYYSCVVEPAPWVAEGKLCILKKDVVGSAPKRMLCALAPRGLLAAVLDRDPRGPLLGASPPSPPAPTGRPGGCECGGARH